MDEFLDITSTASHCHCVGAIELYTGALGPIVARRSRANKTGLETVTMPCRCFPTKHRVSSETLAREAALAPAHPKLHSVQSACAVVATHGNVNVIVSMSHRCHRDGVLAQFVLA